MGIKHAVTKAPGQQVFAVADWNANHIVDSDVNIGPFNFTTTRDLFARNLTCTGIITVAGTVDGVDISTELVPYVGAIQTLIMGSENIETDANIGSSDWTYGLDFSVDGGIQFYAPAGDSFYPSVGGVLGLGTAARYWGAGFIDVLYLNATAYFTGTVAGSATLIGTLAFTDVAKIETVADDLIIENLKTDKDILCYIDNTATGRSRILSLFGSSRSVAIGASTATGTASLAAGAGNQANGNYSVAIGNLMICNGLFSVGIGLGVVTPTNEGDYAIAMGWHPRITAAGDYGVALGKLATVQAASGVAIGDNSLASGQYGISLGWSTASGYASVAIGGKTGKVIASASGSVAMGNAFTNNVADTFMVGFTQEDFRVSANRVGIPNTSAFILPIKATTGDPAAEEGRIYCNTFDNAVRIYIDGAWRDIITW